MTGLVDRINAWLVGKIRPTLPPRFAEDVVIVGERRFPLSRLSRAVGYSQTLYVGQRLALALEFGDPPPIAVSQEDACWPQVTAALDRLGLTALPSAEWTTRLLGGEDVILLRDAPQSSSSATT